MSVRGGRVGGRWGMGGREGGREGGTLHFFTVPLPVHTPCDSFVVTPA